MTWWQLSSKKLRKIYKEKPFASEVKRIAITASKSLGDSWSSLEHPGPQRTSQRPPSSPLPVMCPRCPRWDSKFKKILHYSCLKMTSKLIAKSYQNQCLFEQLARGMFVSMSCFLHCCLFLGRLHPRFAGAGAAETQFLNFGVARWHVVVRPPFSSILEIFGRHLFCVKGM